MSIYKTNSEGKQVLRFNGQPPLHILSIRELRIDISSNTGSEWISKIELKAQIQDLIKNIDNIIFQIEYDRETNPQIKEANLDRVELIKHIIENEYFRKVKE